MIADSSLEIVVFEEWGDRNNKNWSRRNHCNRNTDAATLSFTGDNTLIRSMCCSFNRLLPASVTGPTTSLVFSSIFASRNLAGLLSLTGADLAGNLKLAGKDSLI